MTTVEADAHLSGLSLAYKLLVAYHETFRRLGFNPDEIYVGRYENCDKSYIYVQLQAQGLEFTSVGPCPDTVTQDDFAAAWATAATAWNRGTRAARARLYQESPCGDRRFFMVLIRTLEAKGFRIPAIDLLSASPREEA